MIDENVMPEHVWVFPAQITRVIDGDTLELIIDTGMHTRRIERCRLLGVDTPELFRGSLEERQQGRIAKAFVEEWVKNSSGPQEFSFLIRTRKDPDSFGRYLCDVWSRVTGTCINDILVAQGYGSN